MTQNKKTEEDIIDVPFTEVSTSTDENLNLEDIGYMVVVGRTKDGETIFRTVGINDLIMILGLVDYAREEVLAEIAKHRK
jgi:hypothetical protein